MSDGALQVHLRHFCPQYLRRLGHRRTDPLAPSLQNTPCIGSVLLPQIFFLCCFKAAFINVHRLTSFFACTALIHISGNRACIASLVCICCEKDTMRGSTIQSTVGLQNYSFVNSLNIFFSSFQYGG